MGDTVTKIDTIYKDRIFTIHDTINVYSLIDTTFINTFLFNNVLNNTLTKDSLSFKVLTKNKLQAYADTTFNNIYYDYKPLCRIKDINLKYYPILVPPRYKASLFQCYFQGGADIKKLLNNYNINPTIGIVGIFKLKYEINCNISNNSIYINIGYKLFLLK